MTPQQWHRVRLTACREALGEAYIEMARLADQVWADEDRVAEIERESEADMLRAFIAAYGLPSSTPTEKRID